MLRLLRFSAPVLALIGLMAVTVPLLNVLERLDSDVVIETLGLSACLLAALFIILSTNTKGQKDKKVVLRMAIILWGFLLILEELFARAETSEVEQNFSLAVYGEISLWILSFLIVVVILFRNMEYARRLVSGRSKSLAIFGVVCMLSAAYAPVPLFSAAWAFKLVLVIVVLHLSRSVILEDADLLLFAKTTFWAFTFVMLLGALKDPSSLIVDGRLGYSPTSLAEVAGIVLILSLGLNALSQTRWPLLITLISAAIMFLSGGKAGISGSMLSVGLFFLLKKKVGSGLLLVSALIGFGIVLMLGTSLKGYAENYTENEQADSLTGRTDLWNAAIPLIRQKPVIGHGYMASKYISSQVQGVYWEAGHLHNSFLDVLYNNGILGFLLILYMHAMIIKSLLKSLRQSRQCPIRYELSAVFLAIYSNLLVSSCFNSTIGGRPSYFFMLFMGIYMVSDNLIQEPESRRTTLLLSPPLTAPPVAQPTSTTLNPGSLGVVS